MRLIRTGLLGLLLLQVGCGLTPIHNDSYIVKSGDTLYSIAMHTGVDYRELARLNNLGADYRIYAGQVLRLSSEHSLSGKQQSSSRSSVTSTAKQSAPIPPANFPWQWPCKPESMLETRQPNGSVGLSLRGQSGQDIVASAGGKVVYAGSGLLGYGQLIIIKHDEVYLSAYAHLQTMIVKEGMQITSGQKIATMGKNGAGVPLLYFEIRINGVTVQPLKLLPQSH